MAAEPIIWEIPGTASVNLSQNLCPFSAMNPAKSSATPEASFHEADLLQLELRVAKRADKLWQMAGRGRGRDLVH